MNCPLLIKFGKREHLEQLKNGIVHFSKLEVFQMDPTAYRGDRMEGKDYLDPTKPLLINGLDISPYLKEATISHEFEVPVLSFSASLLSQKNCHKISDDLYTLNDEFIAEMKQFGDHFLVFNAYEFIDALAKKCCSSKCGYEYHPMVYVDKHNYDQVREYYAGLNEERKHTGQLFIKDTINGYPLQNEWRFVVFDDNCHYHLDSHGGVNIQTDFCTEAPVFCTALLNTLECTKEFLFE